MVTRRLDRAPGPPRRRRALAHGERVEPYKPSRCTKHPKREAGVWIASGSTTALGVVPAGGWHACKECWYEMFPPIGGGPGQETEPVHDYSEDAHPITTVDSDA